MTNLKITMGPAQLRTHCAQNFPIEKTLCNQHTVVALPFTPASTIDLSELIGEDGDDLFAIFSTLPLENFTLNNPSGRESI
jgi:hypothetical protein